ncbi:MAG: class I SAM-dependent methyltransferase [Sphingobacteriaceae bacterium]
METFGQAIIDHYQKLVPEILWINNEYGEPEEMPVDLFFRNFDNLPELEIIALKLCRGKVLDVGAGAGSHALLLQENGIAVTALEISSLAAKVIEHRGLKDVICENIFHYQPVKRYDTILLLMNGIGLAGNMANLSLLLNHFKVLLNPGGQIIFDSSDIAYLYGGSSLPKTTYYGELKYQYEYKNQKSDWFQWLYIDQHRLAVVARLCGWNTEIIFEDDMDQYLAKLTLI